ncbi:exonuclease SbcCD subunit D [Candidatus Woesearchaeota archaeon]|nr:exonuclease SbcCD subunit D [Candidatus Woesearchaeota archaeon]
MKFAHMADCHIGGWRDPKLRMLGAQAFCRAIDLCIGKSVDFALISGDLFNTSLPPVDSLKTAAGKLKELNDRGIPAYIISGSHDYSPSGKTMLDVLEEAGLAINVARAHEEQPEEGKLRLKFTVDKKTGAKITGIPGKRAGLDKTFYQMLVREELEQEPGFKIFMFHALIEELKTKEFAHVDGTPASLLPKGFHYYAGGHVHIVKDVALPGYGTIAYPGPLFPNSFSELETLGNGGFYIVEDGKLSFESIQVHNVHRIIANADHKSPEQVSQEILTYTNTREFVDTIVTLRVEGVLASGKPSDVDFKGILAALYSRGAYFVMKNTFALKSKEYGEVAVSVPKGEDVEEKVLKENVGQMPLDGFNAEQQLALARQLMGALSVERQEGERVSDFEKRVKESMEKLLPG